MVDRSSFPLRARVCFSVYHKFSPKYSSRHCSFVEINISMVSNAIGLFLRICTISKELGVGSLIEQHMETGITEFTDSVIGVIIRLEADPANELTATIWRSYRMPFPWIIRGCVVAIILVRFFGFRPIAWATSVPNSTIATPKLSRSPSEISFSSATLARQAQLATFALDLGGRNREDWKSPDTA